MKDMNVNDLKLFTLTKSTFRELDESEKIEILKEYIQWAENLENSYNQFPLNLELYCKLIAGNKRDAKRALLAKVTDNQLFSITAEKGTGGRPREIIMTSLEGFEELMQIEHKDFRALMRECRKILSGTSDIDAADVMTDTAFNKLFSNPRTIARVIEEMDDIDMAMSALDSIDEQYRMHPNGPDKMRHIENYATGLDRLSVRLSRDANQTGDVAAMTQAMAHTVRIKGQIAEAQKEVGSVKARSIAQKGRHKVTRLTNELKSAETMKDAAVERADSLSKEVEVVSAKKELVEKQYSQDMSVIKDLRERSLAEFTLVPARNRYKLANAGANVDLDDTGHKPYEVFLRADLMVDGSLKISTKRKGRRPSEWKDEAVIEKGERKCEIYNLEIIYNPGKKRVTVRRQK